MQQFRVITKVFWNCKFYELLSKIIDNSDFNAYLPPMSAIQGSGETSRTSPKFCWHTETFFCDLHARLEFIDRRAKRKRCCYIDLHNVHLFPMLWHPWIAWCRVSWELLKTDLLVANQEPDRYHWAVVQENITTLSHWNCYDYLKIDTIGTSLIFQRPRTFYRLVTSSNWEQRCFQLKWPLKTNDKWRFIVHWVK